MQKVAIIMLGIHELTGGSGSERFFADVFEAYSAQPERAFELHFIADEITVQRLQEVGRLAHQDRVVGLPNAWPFVGRWSEARVLLRVCRSLGIDLLHIGLVSPAYLPFLWLLGRLERNERPRISITVTNCSLAHRYFEIFPEGGLSQMKVNWLFRLFFNTVHLDGIYSWYELFTKRFAKGVLPSKPAVVTARYCFVDTQRFRPAETKDKRILYAGRLIRRKRPLFFVEAVGRALEAAPDIFVGWRFEIYGKGPLEQVVRHAIREAGLENRITLSHSGTMDAVLAQSMAFVSVQDFENFTSLAMLEAMAAGNAVISRNVGATSEFVRDEENGYLLREDTPAALADALVRYVSRREDHARFAARSREIATTEHCVSNFLGDIERYWQRVIDSVPNVEEEGARPCRESQ